MQGRLCDQVDGLIQAFPWDDWKSEFGIAKEIGLRSMEWTLDAAGLNENPLMTESGRSEIRILSERFDIDIESATGDCFMQMPFWKVSNYVEKSKLVSELFQVVEACSELGITKLVVPIVDNGRFTSSDEESVFVQTMLDSTDYFRSCNVQLIFETEFGPTENLEFISKFPKDVFGINYDSGNSASLGFSVISEFDLFSDRIKNIHIKDRKLNGGTVPLGSGSVDFVELFRCIEKYSYQGCLILQTARALDGDHAGALMRYKDFIQEFWNT